jgi:hypothetical protein
LASAAAADPVSVRIEGRDVLEGKQIIGDWREIAAAAGTTVLGSAYAGVSTGHELRSETGSSHRCSSADRLENGTFASRHPHTNL